MNGDAPTMTRSSSINAGKHEILSSAAVNKRARLNLFTTQRLPVEHSARQARLGMLGRSFFIGKVAKQHTQLNILMETTADRQVLQPRVLKISP